MTVHASSVISPWLNNYYPEFYTALTNQENFAYTTDTLNKWQGMFNSLDGLMTTYKITSRVSAFYDFISAYYTYYLLNQLYGTSGSAIAAGDGRVVFSMNGFTNASVGRATNYYNDWVTDTGSGGVIGTVTVSGGAVTSIALTSVGTLYVTASTRLGISGGGGRGAYATITASPILAGVGGQLTTPVVVYGGSGYASAPTVRICVGTSSKMSADYTTVTNSVTNENNTMTSLQTTYRGSINPIVAKLLFEDVVPLTSLTKQQIVTKFFTDLHYKQVYQYLNMSPLLLPPGA